MLFSIGFDSIRFDWIRIYWIRFDLILFDAIGFNWILVSLCKRVDWVRFYSIGFATIRIHANSFDFDWLRCESAPMRVHLTMLGHSLCSGFSMQCGTKSLPIRRFGRKPTSMPTTSLGSSVPLCTCVHLSFQGVGLPVAQHLFPMDGASSINSIWCGFRRYGRCSVA